MILWIVTVAIVLAGLYFVGRLGYLLFGTVRAVRHASALARRRVQVMLAPLSSDELRQRLLHDSYLLFLAPRAPAVQEFLGRLAEHDEVALAREYSASRLYGLLAKAERDSGATGRPEAVDAAPRISSVLQALVTRTMANDNVAV